MAIALSFWVLSVLGVFYLADLIMYDQFVGLYPEVYSSDSEVALVTTDHHSTRKEGEYWEDFLFTLLESKPRQVIFTFFPPAKGNKFYELCEKNQDTILFSRNLVSNPFDPETIIIEPKPSGVKTKNKDAILYEMPSNHGIYRYHRETVEVNAKKLDTIERVVAKRLDPNRESFENDVFLINFLGGLNRLPQLSSGQVMQGGLSKKILNGKVVLIGADPLVSSQGMHTPIAKSGKSLSRLQYHGYALDTMIADRKIRFAATWIKFLVILIATIYSFILYQKLTSRNYVKFTIASVFAYTVLALLALVFLHVWIPMFEIVFMQIFMFFYVSRTKEVHQEVEIKKMLLNLSVHLQERIVRNGGVSNKEYWSYVAVMVSELLLLKRTIFLERVPGDHRVKEIQALKCSLGDIQEKRRDYERTPYSTAMEQGKPIRVERYLKDPAEDEVQYLVPLYFGGDVQGFWALGIEQKQLDANKAFDLYLRSFGHQISEMLYHRHQWEVKSEEEDSLSLRQYLKMEGGDRAYLDLQRSIHLSERRMLSLEGILEGLSVATVYYDLFGRVLYINKKMTTLIQEIGLQVYKITLIDFIVRITGIERERAQVFVQHVIMEHQTIYLPAGKLSFSDANYLLYMRALVHGDKHDGGQAMSSHEEMSDAGHFRIDGVLCELVDVSDLRDIMRLKDQLFEHTYYKLKNDFEAISMSSSLLREDIEAEEKEQVLSILDTKLDESVATLDEAMESLNKDLVKSFAEHYPIDVMFSMISALENLEQDAKGRHVHFKKNFPELISLVLASPQELNEALTAMIGYLIEDSVEDSQLEISIVEKDHNVTVDLKNQGFGIPNERLQGYIFGEDEQGTEHLQVLRSLLHKVESWGAELSADSQIGRGTHFTLILKSFI